MEREVSDCLLLGLRLDPEDGNSTFLRNVGPCYSLQENAVCNHRQQALNLSLFYSQDSATAASLEPVEFIVHSHTIFLFRSLLSSYLH
jgi:hypothetical protein